ncbi:MAG: alanyl-tRNA editing protein [Thermoanaerobaculum sp.]|nr:alanyl-tRNA editing protein [Thermoanaerobaculum sp.]
MSAWPAYLRDPYMTHMETRVVAAGQDSRGFWVELEDTLFFPEGGGQPADRGTVEGIPVVDVQKAGSAIRHWLAAAPPHGHVRLQLDWQRRYDHMQQHTAQHLLSAVAEDRFGWRTTAFHLGVELCDVELDVPSLTPSQVAVLEQAAMAEVHQAHPIRVHWVGLEELARYPKVRSRGLPEGHEGSIRLVEIVGVDVATCGGTHLRSTAEVEALALLHTEPMRGGTRLYFVAGTRLRQRLHRHEERNAALRRLFGASDGELVTVAETKVGQLEQLRRELRHTQEELAQLLGARLAADQNALVSWHGTRADLAFLQTTARAFLHARSGGTLLLTAGEGAEGVFLLATHRADLTLLGEGVAKILEGRGGGKTPFFQGRAAALHRREVAQKWLAEQLQRPG